MIDAGYEEIVDNLFKKEKELINKRQESNRKLVKIISEMIEEQPELRFGQILCILGIYHNNIDLFNDESKRMLDRVEVKLKNRIKMNTMIINGKRIQVEGNNVSINGNKIFVDGKEVNCEELKGEVTIKWEGDLANLECHNAKIKGNIQGDVDSHNIDITGNVGGNIDSHNVEMRGDVQGDVKGHNIDVSGNVYGQKKKI